MALIHQILRLEETRVSCIERHEPQQLADYETELATRLNAFYRDCLVLKPEDAPVSQARLKLAGATQIALERVLSLMGMRSREEM